MSNQEHKPSFQSIHCPNNTKEIYTFNQASQLESLETNTDTFHYLRDLENRITKISTDKEEQKPTHYSYDAIGILSYDQAGNVQSKYHHYNLVEKCGY